MPGLNIVKGDQIRKSRVVCTLYGLEGRGKTTLALTAPDPLLLDFDGGVHRAPNRSGKDVVQVGTWEQASNIAPEDVAPYKTIIADTVGTMVDLCIADAIRRDPKLGRGGAPTQQCYGVVKSRLSLWVHSLLNLGLNVIFIAHTEERQVNDDMVERILASGATKQLVAHLTDIGGKVYMGPQGERLLTFSPVGLNFGKNPGLPDYTVPPPGQAPTLMADVMRRGLEVMNDQLVRDQKENDRLENLRRTLEGYTQAGQFNDLYEKMVGDNSSPTDRRMLIRAAKSKGLFADRKTQRIFATEADANSGQPAPTMKGQPEPAPATQLAPAAQPATQPTPAAAQPAQGQEQADSGQAAVQPQAGEGQPSKPAAAQPVKPPNQQSAAAPQPAPDPQDGGAMPKADEGAWW